jgi:parallel beta-helix repeat protein
MKRNYSLVIILLCIGFAYIHHPLSIAQTTAFTYQGQLKDGGNPANGLYDLRFTLYNVVTAGIAVAGPVYVDDKTVANGLFSAEVDFGASPFDGSDRWLEIGVRLGSVDNSNRDPASYTSLSPRQKIANNPYALFSRNTEKLAGQTADYYLDASNIISGTLSADRFSAYGDLSAEGKIGETASQVASGSHTHNLQSLSGSVGDGQIPDGITRDNELTDAITTHTANAAAHHAWPLTDAEVPDNITIGTEGSVDGAAIKSGVINQNFIDPEIARDSELRKTYDAIVATSGGDYTSLYEALQDGKTSIFVRNGTYTVYSNLILASDNITIVGESRDGVILNCGGSVSTCFNAQGDTLNYTDGTVTIANGSYTVTGTGTAWLANAAAGEYILLGSDWYQIKGVTSDTELDVARTYWGQNITNATYKIAAMLSNLHIENMTIKTKTAIYFTWVFNATVRNCRLTNNSTVAMYFYNCYNNRILNNIIQNPNNQAIYLYYCNHFQITGNIAEDARYNDTIYLSHCNYNTLLDNRCCNNTYSGIELTSSSWNVIKANICNNNSAGIYLTSSSAQNTISENICIANNYQGIDIQSNSNYNTLSGNVCNSSVTECGIEIGSASKYNTLQGNICYGNAVQGIYLSLGSECVVLGNVCRGNSDYGISIAVNSNNNIVGMNQLSSNTLGAGIDSGTNTMQKLTNYPSF